MTADRVAVGVRAHSGWAAVAVVGGTLREPLILERRRVTLVPDNAEEFTQPYHVAANLGDGRARNLVERAESEAQRLATAGLRELADAVEPHALVSCAILASKARVPDDLESILQSHALIHAAEGNLFRDAVARAARICGLEVFGFVEKEIEDQLNVLRASPGPPWSKDEKLASLAGFLALDQYQRALSATVASG